MVVSPWWGGTRAGLRRVARLQACVGAGAATGHRPPVAGGRWPVADGSGARWTD
ncbi:hypothetical protein [Acidovorax sp. sif1233]|uniref:hypothetical protein n=1 Tax=Acidovorax sp. sif1233 TaxID=2854792 RepID=UPI001C48C410|nr:hypothetical protein [Acidovorax sp. sif1233]